MCLSHKEMTKVWDFGYGSAIQVGFQSGVRGPGGGPLRVFQGVCRKMRNSYISLLFLIKVRKLNRNYVWTLVFFFKRVQLTCQVLFLLNWHPQFYCNSKTPLFFFTVISKHSTYIKKNIPLLFSCVVQWVTAGTPAACPPGATSPAAPHSSRATTPSATAWMATAMPVWTWECQAPLGSSTDPLPTPHMEVSSLPLSHAVVALSCCWFNSSSHIRFHFYESFLTGVYKITDGDNILPVIHGGLFSF